MSRQISRFATMRSCSKEQDDTFEGVDESKMERAFESLMSSAEGIDENDPRQMASVMRRFTEQTGLNLGDAMEEAISRMEAGEDPDSIEQDMGDLLDTDDFSLESLKKKSSSIRRAPIQDEKLYKL